MNVRSGALRPICHCPCGGELVRARGGGFCCQHCGTEIPANSAEGMLADVLGGLNEAGARPATTPQTDSSD
jgi:tRNA(Ile2) C34 agmatinyltransferase TiaS